VRQEAKAATIQRALLLNRKKKLSSKNHVYLNI